MRSLIANLATLGMAFVLALIIWAAAVRSTDPPTTQFVQIPVQVLGVPQDAVLQNRGAEVVLVTIEGRDSALTDLSIDDFSAFIDLSEVPYGETEVDIQVQFEHDQIRATLWFPERTTIRMEQIITREIPVRPDLRGEVARGHIRGEPFIEPAFIQVTGPASRVESLAEARVTIFMNNERQAITVSRRPTFYDIQGNVTGISGLTLNPDEVEVTISVDELAGFAEKPITADWVGVPVDGYRLLNVSVQPQSVLVTGPPASLDNLRGLRTDPIDISGLTESFTQQVSLVLPEGIVLDETQPIIVTVEIEPILTSAVISKEPELRALGPDLVAILDPEEVRVFLFGPLPVLDSLQDGDLRVTLDLLNLDVGVHTLEPIVDVFANEVEVRSVQPPLITVNITRPITTTDEFAETISMLQLRPSPTLVVETAGPGCLLGQANSFSTTCYAVLPRHDWGVAL